MINSIGSVSVRQFGLAKLGLVPAGQMEDIVRGAIGLASEGFFEGVADGSIAVHRDRTITRLLGGHGGPAAELSDGSTLRADLVLCATGFTQGVPFLPAETRRQLLDERGNFMLYRQILPLGVPGLYFNGYNSSFFSPLNAEMAALWIGADLAEAVALPGPEAMRRAVVEQLAFMDGATDTHHCRDTKIIPFSMHNVDEVLADLDLNIGATVRASHWLGAVDPAAYRRMTPLLLRRLPPSGPRPGPGFTGLTPVDTSPEAKKCPATCGAGACPGTCQAPLARPGEARQGPGGAHDPSAVGRVPQHPWGPAQLPAECGSAAADGRCSCASARGQSPGGGPQLELSGVPGGGCLLAAGRPPRKPRPDARPPPTWPRPALARRPRGLGLTFGGGGEGAPGPHRFVTPTAAPAATSVVMTTLPS
ncbi:hypothetical protein ACIBMX_17900 [Streptomyces phaeochromogenes]|uniref:hypothetical protein n=1 Tax=Streptomyces phaeochromogenes TaxID=1923 RepID=UPI0033C73EFA